MPGGGGGHSGLNGYPLPNDHQSGSGEHRNSGTVISFWGKRGGRSTQTMNIIGALAYTLCLYSLDFIRYMAFFI